MKKTDKLVRLLMADIENRDILEAACGTADFSLSALPFAGIVSTWSLDTGLIRDTFGDKAVMRDDFLIVRIAV